MANKENDFVGGGGGDNGQIKLAVYNFEKRLDIFHVGILVNGKEFHYGVRQGVLVCNPGNDGRLFRVTVYNVLPREMAFLRYVDIHLADGSPLTTSLSLAQLLRVKTSLECGRFGPNTYRLFRNNCVDFAVAFIRLIAAPQSGFSKSWLPKEVRQPWITQPIRAINRKISQNRRKKHILQLSIH